MTIGEIINHYGEDYTPYIGGLVNHLPMGQLAIYKMTKDLRKVKSFTKSFLERNNIDEIKDSYSTINTIEETVGDRSLYKPCLDILRRELNPENLDNYVNDILNKYILGLSSGLFHTSIRLAYAIEGIKLDPILISEVERALSYYITGYRESKLFTRQIQDSKIREEMDKLANDNLVRDILKDKETLGKKIKAMYSEKDFIDKGFIIEGDSKDKIMALLDLLIPEYYLTGNFVVLHCITGLHAIIVLKDYFDDYSLTLNILTTSIIVHLLAIENNNYGSDIDDFTHISWDAILNVASDQLDAHAVKLAYTCFKLDKLYNKKGLKDIAIKRIRHS